jgi:hypothetical protein
MRSVWPCQAATTSAATPTARIREIFEWVYKRNYIQRGDAFNIEADEIGFDCMTELVFADRDDLSAWMTSLGVDEIAQDDENFIDRTATRAWWWTSAPPRAERRASTHVGLNTHVTAGVDPIQCAQGKFTSTATRHRWLLHCRGETFRGIAFDASLVKRLLDRSPPSHPWRCLV